MSHVEESDAKKILKLLDFFFCSLRVLKNHILKLYLRFLAQILIHSHLLLLGWQYPICECLNTGILSQSSFEVSHLVQFISHFLVLESLSYYIYINYDQPFSMILTHLFLLRPRAHFSSSCILLFFPLE